MKKSTLLYSFLLITLHSSFFTFSQVPSVPKNIGFAGMNVQLDDDARAVVQADVNALMVNKKYWEAKLDRCLLYFPIVEGILIDEEIPTDFKYLVVQESSLQPDAISASNAVGYWQFKKETALDYGLRVDNDVDERKNIVSSTHAAAQYLKKSNTQFNNWIASLYSFYLGAGTIAKNIPVDWGYAKEIKLTGESDKYILRFFAHKIAIESGLGRYQSGSQMQLVEYPKVAGRSLMSIAKELDIDEASLRAYNRWVMGNNVPNDKDYVMIVPSRGLQTADVKAKIASSKGVNNRDNFAQNDIGFPILKRSEETNAAGAILYEINTLPGIMASNGDDAGSLAQKAKVSYGSFLRYNDMSEEDPIKPGEVYYLGKKLKKAVVPFHTVREGESLWRVSQIYGIRLSKLIKNNRILNRNQRLQTGRVLWLMEKRPRKAPIEVVEMPQQQPIESAPAKRSQPRPAAKESTEIVQTTPQTVPERKVYTPKMADPQPPKSESTKPDMGEEVVDVPVKATPKQETATKPTRRATSFNPSKNDEKEKVLKEEEDTKTQVPKINNQSTTTTPKAQPAIITQQATNGSFYHPVELGQTFFSIAKMYEVSVKDVLAWNNLADDAKLQAGQKLLIKTVGKTVEKQPIEKAEFIIHTVDMGENMFRIAQKYGVKMVQIKEWNSLTEDAVKVGQQLKIKKP